MTFIKCVVVTPSGHREIALLRTTTPFEVVFQHLLRRFVFEPEVQDLHGMRFRYYAWPVFGHQTPEDLGITARTEILLTFPYEPLGYRETD